MTFEPSLPQTRDYARSRWEALTCYCADRRLLQEDAAIGYLPVQCRAVADLTLREAAHQRFLNCGGRFSAKAAMPSF